MNAEPLLGRNPGLVPVSNSEIGCFKGCRRRWWLAYYRGLRQRRPKLTGPLPLGTRVHAALEAQYAHGADPVSHYVGLLHNDRQVVLEAGLDPKDFDSDGELGRIMLEGYVTWLEETGADSGLEIVGAEKKVSALLLDGRVELRGKLDLRLRRKIDGVRLMLDHKTCATFDSITRTAHINEQPLMYQLLETLTTEPGDERCDGMIYNMLRKVRRTANARPPFYERLEIRYNKHTLRSFWARVHGTINDMLHVRAQLDAGADPSFVAYPTPTPDCSWKCEFFAACPLFDDGSAVEELLDRHYVQDDPYQRYENHDKVTPV